MIYSSLNRFRFMVSPPGSFYLKTHSRSGPLFGDKVTGTFVLVADAACTSGGICTAGGTVLTQVPAALTIPGPDDAEEAAELTASFSGMPAEHAGEEFTARRLSWRTGSRTPWSRAGSAQ